MIIALRIDKSHILNYDKAIIFYSDLGDQMQVEYIYQNHFENTEQFKTDTTRSEWDWLIVIADGAFSFLPHTKSKPTVLQKAEIAFIPSGTEFERKILSPISGYNIFFNYPKDHPFYADAPVGKLQLPQKQAEAILESIKRASILPFDRESITNIITHIFTENYLFGKNDKSSSNVFSEHIEEAIRYMRNNLDQKIDMDELASHVHLSHSGLIWKFKQELNTTPSQYLILLRLRHAKQLLLNYSYNISEVSAMCGYQNPYYFTNVFRKYTGRSPTEFRRKHISIRK